MDKWSVLILPGLGNSGAEHWQSLWEARHPSFTRVTQRDWDHPAVEEWTGNLQRHVAAATSPVVLVAHSLACALAAHWAMAFPTKRVAGALLVSPSDVDSELHTPPEVRCFSPMPLTPLPFLSTVIASTNDPYVAFARARFFAERWGSNFVDVGAKGQINAASGLGEWDEGFAHLTNLLKQIGGTMA